MNSLRSISPIFALIAMIVPSSAQVVATTPGTTYLAVVGPVGGGVCVSSATPSTCVNPGLGIPLDNYAATSSVDSQFASVNSQLATLNNLARQNTSFAAAVGATHDAIPNAGDRYAVRFNTSSVGNAVGAGVSASANLDDHFRASLNYGSARGQNVVSGGLNFSFH